MRSARLLFAALFATPAWAWKSESAAGLRKRLKSGDATVVAYIIPEMENSKALLSELKTASKSIKGKADVVCISCTDNVDLCNAMDVVSFPTVRFYRDGERPVRFRGPRKANSIAAFARRLSRPVVEVITSANATAFASSDDFVFVASTREDDGSKLSTQFRHLAEKYRDQFTFGLGDGDGAVHCFNNIDGSKHSVDNIHYVAALEDLVRECREVAVPRMTELSEARYQIEGKNMLYMITSDEDERAIFATAVKSLIAEHPYLRFVTVDPSDHKHLPRQVGIPGGRGMALRNTQSGSIYLHEGDIETHGINSFILSATAGDIAAWDGEDVTAKRGKDRHDEL